MMRTVVSVLLISMLSLCVFSSCNNRKAPNSSLQASFENMFPNAKSVRWEMKGNYHVTDFKDDGFEKEAWFDNDGTWWMTHTEYNRNPPLIIRQAIERSQYRDWRIDDVDFIEQRDYSAFYNVELERNDVEMELFFSVSGELLTERPAIVIPLPYL